MATQTAVSAIGARRRRRPRIYLYLAVVGVAAALGGFATTFFAPLLRGTFAAPVAVYVHGAFLFGWVAFVVSQSMLIHRARLPYHRMAGWGGTALAAAVVVSTLAAALYASRRMTAEGDAPEANAQLLVILVDMAVFAALIGFAIRNRKQPEIHRRLMILALLQVLAPAWFRFRHYFPEVDNPMIIFALLLPDSLILIAAIYDRFQIGRVHPVYFYVGGGMFLLHTAEVMLVEWSPVARVAAAIAQSLL
jgi:hypothetical protein